MLQIGSKFSSSVRHQRGVGRIEYVLIVSLGNNVNRGETESERQVVDAALVRSERHFREIKTGELADANSRAIFKLHLGKTVLCRCDGPSFLDRSVQCGALPLWKSRPSRQHRALYQTQAHD